MSARRQLAIVLVAAAAVVAAATACGKSRRATPGEAGSATGADAGAGTIEATGADLRAPASAAPEPAAWWADRPEPALRALGSALEQLAAREVDDWLDRRKLPGPEGEPPEPPPASVATAIDALIAWDGSGALAPMPCSQKLGGAMPYRLFLLAKAALEVASGPADPAGHAALRLGLALRAGDNDAMPMMIGAGIADEAAKVFARKGVTTAVPASFAVAEDLPWRVLDSNARCVAWTLDTLDLASKEGAELVEVFTKMGRKPAQALAEETQAVNAFWAGTLAQARQARTRAELLVVLERRLEEARAARPRSMLVPLLGAPYAAKSLLRDPAPDGHP